MKLPRLFASLALLIAALSPGFAQSTVTTERTVGAPVTTVETRTFVNSEGKTVTERVTTNVQAERSVAAKTYIAAVVVSNRADAKFDDKVSALEDLLAARLSDLGFQLVSRELVTSNLRNFVPPGAASNAESAKASAAAEAAFLDQSSALHLAQNLGADYLLHASITSYNETERKITAYGNTLNNYDYTLRIAYKLLDANAGGALTGDVIKSVHTEQGTANASATVGGIFDDLLDDATQQITTSLRARRDANRIAKPSTAPMLAKVTINIDSADLMIPDIRVNQSNVVVTTGQFFKATPLSATVEIDGVAVGTAPGVIKIRPGFSRLRISRTGFEPWERTVNALDGMTLNISLKLDEAGLKQWRESTKFLNELRDGAKLTDAEVKVLEGEAARLNASGYKVDVKVDTKENFKFIVPGSSHEVH